nr:MAG TPA: Terminase large subunit [Bacteriophage sp.]
MKKLMSKVPASLLSPLESADEFKDILSSLENFTSKAMYIVDKKRNYVPLVMTPAQQAFAEPMLEWINGGKNNGQRNKLVSSKARQQGASTITLALLYYICLLEENLKIVYVFQQSSSAIEFFNDKVIPMFENVRPEFMPTIEQYKIDGKNHIKFVEWFGKSLNNDIMFVSANSIDALRGLTPHILILDEFGFYKNQTEVLDAVSVAIPDDTFSITTFVSTFKGIDAFYDQMVSTKNNPSPFERFVFVPWYLVPEYSREEPPTTPITIFPQSRRDELLNTLKKAPDVDNPQHRANWYIQRYQDVNNMEMMRRTFPTTFEELALSGTTSVFPQDILSRYLQNETPPLSTDESYPELEYWRPPRPNGDYYISIDPADTLNNDNTAITVFDRGKWEITATFASNEYDVEDIADITLHLQNMYPRAKVLVENNMGKRLIDHLENNNVRRILTSTGKISTKRDKNKGVRTDVKNKRLWVEYLVGAIQSEQIRPRGKWLLEELLHFAKKTTASGHTKMEAQGKFSNGEKMKDDRVMSLVILMSVLGKHSIEEQYKKNSSNLDPYTKTYLGGKFY